MKNVKTRIAVLSVMAALALALTACNLADLIQGTEASAEAPVSAQVSTKSATLEIETDTGSQNTLTYPIVDTDQEKCYNNNQEIPFSESAFTGQDAMYMGSISQYRDNGDGTISDLVTGLMWQQDPGEKMTYEKAVNGASTFELAGYTDWRLPTIKELYSLILFDGTDASSCLGTCSLIPFIDTRYFDFSYGDTAAGERVIDSQFATSTHYGSTTMHGAMTMFGVNFADGRIKGYPVEAMPGQNSAKTFFVLYVRGVDSYGLNEFVDQGNGTILDHSTGLTWMQVDSQTGMDWQSALEYCEALDFAGQTDWRLPDVKELQSIVDYTRSPDITASAAIDPLFQTTSIINEAGQSDYPYFWSSTTHVETGGEGSTANYVSFGRAMGYMDGWIDVHGAGAQRSDPKTGSASSYPEGHGPQGDAIRIQNYARCVRGGGVTSSTSEYEGVSRPQMTVESTGINMDQMDNQQNQSTGQTPPVEALQACLNASRGDSCQFTLPNDTLNGTCSAIQQQLVCVPAGGIPDRRLP